jgi:hypothetical protein
MTLFAMIDILFSSEADKKQKKHENISISFIFPHFPYLRTQSESQNSR